MSRRSMPKSVTKIANTKLLSRPMTFSLMVAVCAMALLFGARGAAAQQGIGSITGQGD